MARISIGCLAYSLARRKDLPQYKSTLGYLTGRLEQTGNNNYPEYTRYYQAQALFQGDVDAWEKWNRLLVRELKQNQQSDGSFNGQFGRGHRHFHVTIGPGAKLPLPADLRALTDHMRFATFQLIVASLLCVAVALCAPLPAHAADNAPDLENGATIKIVHSDTGKAITLSADLNSGRPCSRFKTPTIRSTNGKSFPRVIFSASSTLKPAAISTPDPMPRRDRPLLSHPIAKI